MILFQVFGALMILFGICLIFFNNFWQNHIYGYSEASSRKIRDIGWFTKKRQVIILGISAIMIGLIFLINPFSFESTLQKFFSNTQ